MGAPSTFAARSGASLRARLTLASSAHDTAGSPVRARLPRCYGEVTTSAGTGVMHHFRGKFAVSATWVLDQLRKEHAAISGEVKALASSLGQLHRSEGETPATIEAIASRFKGLHTAFLAHRRREEEGLFPTVVQMISEGALRLDIIVAFFAGEAEEDIGAHEEVDQQMLQIAALLDRMGGAQGGETEALARLAEVCEVTFALLERHADKEDALVFPMVARMLSDEQLQAVQRRLQTLPSGTCSGRG